MTLKIKTMNKISRKGLDLFTERYVISDTEASPHAIVVRSAQVNTDEFSGVLAVARAGAGTNNITIPEASAKGVCVFNTPGANANAVSELVFTSLGVILRNLHKSQDFINSIKNIEDDAEVSKLVESNKSKYAGAEMAGKTMGVVGLGKIGVLVANGSIERCMKAIAYEPYPNVSNMHMLHPSVTVTQNLSEVIAASDFLSLHVPYNQGTKGLLNEETLKDFSKNGIILNFARGGIVDIADSLKLLDENKLGGIVTDFPTHAELNNPKILCLPHLGASTEEAEENCATMAVAQIKDYLEFGIVHNSVNFPTVEGRPSSSVKSRIIVINTDVPNMIANITKVVGDAGLNIQSFKNESNGKIGYNIIDLETSVGENLMDSIRSLANVLKVRLINF
jgi:D-3-phosphoglycerate dehydrogenase